MTRRVLPEWNGPQLIYVEPTQVVKSFGYAGVRQRAPEAYGYLQNALDRAEEADGEVSSHPTRFANPDAGTMAVKSLAMDLGADLVGINPGGPMSRL